MVKTQIYFAEGDLEALRDLSRRTRRSVAALVREAVGRVWLPRAGKGPVALWDAPCGRSSADHDSIYDEQAETE